MTEKNEQKPAESKTGRYVYDKKLGKLVKISDDVPGLNKGGGQEAGGCPYNPGGHQCGGGCGCHG